jgi:hypothetical protein
MTELLVRRRVVYADTPEGFEDKINVLADVGYTLEHFQASACEPNASEFVYVGVAKLKEDPVAHVNGMTDFMEIPIDKIVGSMAFGSPLIEKALAEGWQIGRAHV